MQVNADVRAAQRNLKYLQTNLREIAQSGINVTPFNESILQATQSAKELQLQLANAMNPQTGNISLSKLQTGLAQSGKTLTDLTQNLAIIGPTGERAFLQLYSALTRSNLQLTQSTTLIGRFVSTLKNTFRWQLSANLIHGFMGALSRAYGYAQDLDDSLNRIRIVTGHNTEQMAEFAEQANKAAKALNTTTTDYTNAALIFYQQGLNDDEVAVRTETTLKLANVAGESAEAVSQEMTAIWNNFDDGTKSLEYYADAITALGASTASSSKEIAEGLQQFAAVADTVGLSYEYSTAALATVVATTRQSANVVGNAFKTLFSRIEGLKLGGTLEDGTDLNKYSEALLAVGINIKNSNGELKAMDQILDELGAKWNTLNTASQVALAQTVGGARQYTQLIALMDNYDFFKQNVETARNSEGSLQQQAERYAESWEAASKRVKTAWQGLYQTVVPTQSIIKMTDVLSDTITAVDKIIESMGGLKTVVLGLASVFISQFQGTITNSINSAIGKIQELNIVLTPSKWLDKQGAGTYEKYIKGQTPIEQQISDSLNAYNEQGNKSNTSLYFRDAVADLTQINTLRNTIVQNARLLTAEEKEQLEVQLKQLETLTNQKMMLSQQKTEIEGNQIASRTIFTDETADKTKYNVNDNNTELTASVNIENMSQKTIANAEQHIQQLATIVTHNKDIQISIDKQNNGQLKLINNSEEKINLESAYLDLLGQSLTEISTFSSIQTQIFDIIKNSNIPQSERLRLMTEIVDAAQNDHTITAETGEELKGIIQTLTIIERSILQDGHSLGDASMQTRRWQSELTQVFARLTTAARVLQHTNNSIKESVNLGTKQAQIDNQRNNVLQNQKNIYDQINTSLGNIFNRTISITGNFVSLASNLSSIAMAANAWNTAIKNWQDPEVDSWQKLLSTTMALTMSLGTLKTVLTNIQSAYTSFNSVQQVAILLSKESAIQQGLTTIQDVKATAMLAAKEAASIGATQAEKAQNIERAVSQKLIEQNISSEKANVIAKALSTSATKIEETAITEETAALQFDTMMSRADAEAKKELAVATGVASAAMVKFQIVATILIVVITAIVTAYNRWHNSITENNKRIIEENLKVSEQIESVKELALTIDELVNEYYKFKTAGDSVINTLSEMNDKVPELIEKYKELAKTIKDSKLDDAIRELEAEYNAAKITGNFVPVQEKSNNINNQINQYELEQLTEARNAAAIEIRREALPKNIFGWKFHPFSEQHGSNVVSLKGITPNSELINLLQDKLGDSAKIVGGDKNNQHNLQIEIDSVEELIEVYQKLLAIRNEARSNEKMSNEVLFESLNNFLNNTSDSWEKLSNASENFIPSVGLAVEQQLKLNDAYKTGVNDLSTFIAYKRDFIAVGKEQYSVNENEIDSYLRQTETLKDLYTQYDIIAQLNKKFFNQDFESLSIEEQKKIVSELNDSLKSLTSEQHTLILDVVYDSRSIEEFQMKVAEVLLESQRLELQNGMEATRSLMESAIDEKAIKKYGFMQGEVFSQGLLESLENNKSFINYLNNLGIDFEVFKHEDFDDQYNLLANFYQKIRDQVTNFYAYERVLYQQNYENYRQMLLQQIEAREKAQADGINLGQVQEQKEKLEFTINNTGSTQQEIDDAKVALDELKQKLLEEYNLNINFDDSYLLEQMEYLENKIDETFNREYELDVSWDNVDELENGLKRLGNFASTVKKDTRDVGDAYLMTAAKARQWMEIYPELEKYAKITHDGLLSFNKAELDAFIDAQEGKMKSSIKADIETLKSRETVLEGNIKAAETDLKVAKSLTEGKMNLEHASADYVQELRNRLTQILINLGLEETEANAEALKVMGLDEEEYQNLLLTAQKIQLENFDTLTQNEVAIDEAGTQAKANDLQQHEDNVNAVVNEEAREFAEGSAQAAEAHNANIGQMAFSLKDLINNFIAPAAIAISGLATGNIPAAISGGISLGNNIISTVKGISKSGGPVNTNISNVSQKNVISAIKGSYLDPLLGEYKEVNLDIEKINHLKELRDSGDTEKYFEELRKFTAPELETTIENRLDTFYTQLEQVRAKRTYLEALYAQDIKDFGADSVDDVRGKQKNNKGKSKKDKDKQEKDFQRDRDLYHKLEQELKYYNYQLDRTQQLEDKLYGISKVKNLEKQIEYLDKLIDTQDELANFARDTLDEDYATMKAIFKESGIDVVLNEEQLIIENYATVFNQMQDLMDQATKTFNASEQTDADKKAYERAKNEMERQKKALEQYEDSWSHWNEAVSASMELALQKQEKVYQQMSHMLSIHVQINENSKKLIESLVKYIGDDFYKYIEQTKTGLINMDYYIYPLQEYKKQFDKITEARINSQISQQDYIDGLQEIFDGTIDNIDAMVELDRSMNTFYSTTLSKGKEEISLYTSQMNKLIDRFDHYKTILDLLGRDNKDYIRQSQAIFQGQAESYERQMKVSQANYEMLKNQANLTQELWDSVKFNPNDINYLQYKDQWKAAQEAQEEAYSEMLSNAEAFGEAWKQLTELEIQRLKETYEDTMTTGIGPDELTNRMKLTSQYQDEYLTKTNQIYEANALLHKVEQARDKTNSRAAKSQYENFAKEIEQLREKNKLTVFEIEEAKLKYKLLEAQIALEDAQNTKSVVRLQRDTEGNYGYVYTADKDKIADAEQAVRDAENDLYNFRLKNTNDYGEKVVQAWNELNERIAEINNNAALSEQEKQQQRAIAIQQYYDLIGTYADIWTMAQQNDARVVADAWINSYDDQIEVMRDGRDTTEQYAQDCSDAFIDYQNCISEVSDIIGTDLESTEAHIDEVTKAHQDLYNELVEYTIPAVEDELTEAFEEASDYAQKHRQDILDLIDTYRELANAVQKALTIQSDTKNQNITDWSAEYTKDMEAGRYDKAKQDLENRAQKISTDENWENRVAPNNFIEWAQKQGLVTSTNGASYTDLFHALKKEVQAQWWQGEQAQDPNRDILEDRYSRVTMPALEEGTPSAEIQDSSLEERLKNITWTEENWEREPVSLLGNISNTLDELAAQSSYLENLQSQDIKDVWNDEDHNIQQNITMYNQFPDIDTTQEFIDTITIGLSERAAQFANRS